MLSVLHAVVSNGSGSFREVLFMFFPYPTFIFPIILYTVYFPSVQTQFANQWASAVCACFLLNGRNSIPTKFPRPHALIIKLKNSTAQILQLTEPCFPNIPVCFVQAFLFVFFHSQINVVAVLFSYSFRSKLPPALSRAFIWTHINKMTSSSDVWQELHLMLSMTSSYNL